MAKITKIGLMINDDCYTFEQDDVMNVNRTMKVLYGIIKEIGKRYAIVLQNGSIIGMYPTNK